MSSGEGRSDSVSVPALSHDLIFIIAKATGVYGFAEIKKSDK